MTLFLTGATGYIGSYVAQGLLREHEERLAVLVRARDSAHAEERLWRSLQLHMPFEEFIELIRTRVDIYLGDLTAPDLGFAAATWRRAVRSFDSVIHCAASLNRKSAKACFNVNLRGTLTVLRLARAAEEHHGLRRFSDVSTVAVAGHRGHETVLEDGMIDWSRSDYDPYARTKKFCEHMLDELLPDTPSTVFRPSTVLGDSRFPETTQFDMVRAFVLLASLPVLPFAEDWRMDIAPVDWVARGIVHVHQSDAPRHDAYNLSSGESSLTFGQITDALVAAGHDTRPRFVPGLSPWFARVVDGLSSTPRGWKLALPASLLKVFLPYLTYDTVFDNRRIVEELGEAPVPFSEYCLGLLRFASGNDFRYPYLPWPDGVSAGVS